MSENKPLSKSESIALMRQSMGLPPIPPEEIQAQVNEDERQQLIKEGRRMLPLLSRSEVGMLVRKMRVLTGEMEEGGEND